MKDVFYLLPDLRFLHKSILTTAAKESGSVSRDRRAADKVNSIKRSDESR